MLTCKYLNFSFLQVFFVIGRKYRYFKPIKPNFLG